MVIVVLMLLVLMILLPSSDDSASLGSTSVNDSAPSLSDSFPIHPMVIRFLSNVSKSLPNIDISLERVAVIDMWRRLVFKAHSLLRLQ